jgi:outer membrane protein assembly factor BamD
MIVDGRQHGLGKRTMNAKTRWVRSTDTVDARACSGFSSRFLQIVAMATCLAVLAPLGGCSTFGGDTASLATPDPVEKIYADADALLTSGDYKGAATKFEDVERNYPFSNDPSKPYARKSLALAAYAYYKAGDYDNAIAAGKRYTSMHAGTEDAPLAHHVVAMSYYDQMQDASRDQTFTKKAIEEFDILRRQYPESKYAQEAENRLRVANDQLAAADMEVGRYYLKRKNYLAATNRFKAVVSDHQNTKHVEEALQRLVECYMALGIRPEAQTAAAILGHNFPNSPWYKDAYALLQSDGLEPREDSGSWLSQIWKKTVRTIGSAG